ncbi:MAG: penicillin acylase family protein [Aureispira sp.]|nr:penicillin acylase family protein [Aureispira sp.]
MGILQQILKPLLKYTTTRWARQSMPNYDEKIPLKGIDGKIEIVRDEWGVPHIQAQSQKDLFFAQGFAHAQDRLWQMEVNRRVAAGRLSEVFGELALDTDRIVRTLGFRRLGLQDYNRYKNNELLPLVEAYTKGINAYIDRVGKKLPPEFKLVRFQPEKWDVVDSLSIARFLSFQMSLGWMHELERLKITEKVGLDKASKLFPQYPKENPAALDQIETYKIEDGRMQAFDGPFLNKGGASNNWTIAADRMSTGSAALCNDPHLLINVPNIWYENHLISPDFEVTGVSIPGAPLVMIGHNRKIAWGATLAYTDAQDLYVEQFTGDSCKQYNSGERILKATHFDEVIKIKGKKDHIEKVIYTHHGPVISDIVGYPNKKITLCSQALKDSEMIFGFYHLNTAENWDDFVGACEQLSSPPLSLVFADTNDNIGYYLTGKMPIRQNTKGLLPHESKYAKHEWKSYIPFEKMPHALNPKKGYFYTCNHKLVDDNYPYDLGHIWMDGFRANRLKSLLESKEQYSFDDFKSWQMDFYCIPGKKYADLYKSFLERLETGGQKPSKTVLLAMQTLADWDGYLTADSVGGCLYQVVKQELIDRIFGPELGNQVRGKGWDEAIFRQSEFWGHDTMTILRLLETKDSDWIKEDVDTILLQAMIKAVQYLEQKLGAGVPKWEWGRLHKIGFHHALGSQKPLDQIFNIGDYPIGGDTDTLCQTAFIPGNQYGGTLVAASYRQIIDMGNLSNSLCMAPGGQSGNHISLYYDNQVEPWLKGEYKPMVWTREQIQQYGKYKMTLDPEV